MGTWPSDYIATTRTSGFGGKVVSNNWGKGGFGVTDSVMISGHRVVKEFEDLYEIPEEILSSKKSNSGTSDGSDAVGQLWYVEEEGVYYQLVAWADHDKETGWSRTNIRANKVVSDDLRDFTQYANTDGSKGDCIRDLEIRGDGTLSYTAWNLNMTNNPTAGGVELKYTKSDDKTVKTLTTIPNVSEAATTSGVISSAQYKSLLDRIAYLETWTIWKARVGTDTNTSTYLWSGSLADFNALGSDKPTDTTFIVTN